MFLLFTLLLANTITSSFGENRGIRFHMGLDISTQREKGVQIYSPFKGTILKIKDLWTGYGRALYLKNNKGDIWVYVHLERFKDEIERFIYKEKKRKRKHQIVRYTNFEVDSGEVIAFSGNSGTIIPHIHLETRREFALALNPYYFFNVFDTIKPEIRKILIFPLGYSKLEGGWTPLEFTRPFPETISAGSDFWLWISAGDIQDRNSNQIAPYRYEFYIFDSLICRVSLDSINYNDNFLARALYSKTESYFSTSYIHPLPLENPLWTGSTFISYREPLFPLKIVVYDFWGNKDESIIWIKNKKHPAGYLSSRPSRPIIFLPDGILFKTGGMDSISIKNLKNLNWLLNKTDTFREDKILIKLGQYGRIQGAITSRTQDVKIIRPFKYYYLFPLSNKTYRVKLKDFEIKIEKRTLFFPYPLFFSSKPGKLEINSIPFIFRKPIEVKIKKKGFILLKNEEKFVTTDTIAFVNSPGIFYLKKDTIPPHIHKENFLVMEDRIRLNFKVIDDIGVKEVFFYLNGEWEPVIYNPNTGELQIEIFRGVKSGKNNFMLEVSDFGNNKRRMNGTF